MSYQLNFSVPNNYEDLWLIGIRIDPNKEDPDFYTIFFAGDKDIPLTVDNYIIFFNKIDCLSTTIKTQIPKIYKDLNLSEIFIVDIAQSLYRINLEVTDDSTIINSLNIIIDLVRASKLTMPDNYKNILFKVADYFTFNQDIANFFVENNIKKVEVINIILWCIGAIVSKSKFITE